MTLKGFSIYTIKLANLVRTLHNAERFAFHMDKPIF